MGSGPLTGIFISLLKKDQGTVGKREKLEDIVLNLCQVEVLQGQGKPLADGVRQTNVTIQTYHRGR